MEQTKRMLAVLLALVLLACSAPLAFGTDVIASGTCGDVWNSATQSYDNLTWSLDSEGTLTIEGEGNMCDYDNTYDSTLGGDRTTAPWGQYAGSIKAVVVGDSVTSIGYHAFLGCTALESVTIPDSVTSIGQGAFCDCAALESVTIGDSVTNIGSWVFSGCTALESVTIGDSVTSIDGYAFYGCTALRSIVIPDSVTSIGSRAFYNCIALSTIVFPENMPAVGKGAFYGCTSIIDFLVDIDGGDCGKNLTWSLNNTGTLTISGGGQMNSYGTTDDNGVSRTGAPWGKYYNTIQSVVIGNNVTSISSSAFRYCTALESATIGNSVKSIGISAFYNCTALTSVTIPDSVTSIGDYAFYGCTALESVTLPDYITSISSRAFGSSGYSDWCILVLCNKNTTTAATLAASESAYAFLDGTDEDNLIHKVFNKKLTYTINKRTRTLTVENNGDMVSFSAYTAPWREYQKYITDVVILPGCTSVSDGAFAECYNIKRVTLPDGIERIGNQAFRYCRALESIALPDGVTSIGEWAFYDCRALESIALPDGVTSIGSFAFGSCYALESIVIPDSVTSIGERAFRDCSALKTAVIGDGVRTIPYEAFSGCSSLHTVVLPESVRQINGSAFSSTALEDIYIYNKTCSINENAIYPSATIHGYLGSTAEAFADNYGYDFEPLTDAPAHEHDSTLVPGTAPTCTDAGLTDGYQCSVCGKWITKQKPIKALDHDYQVVETVLPTATEAGHRRWQCSRCDAGYTEVLPVNTHEHSFTVTDSRDATCTEGGFTTYVCYGCGHSYTDILEPLDHAFGPWKTFLPTEAGVKGIDVRFCSRCGFYELRESETAGSGTTPTDPPVNPSHTHTFTLVDSKDATCGLAGYKRYICTCGETKADIIDALEHDYVIGATVAATCNETGYTLFVCSRCGAEKQTDLVPALSHEDKNGDGKCDRCGIQTGTPTNPCANGHDFYSWVLVKEGNCTIGDVMSRLCRVCGYVETIAGEPKGEHHFVEIAFVSATCVADGKRVERCSVCGETMTKTLPKDPNAHVLKTTVYPPTCLDEGYTSHACTLCRYGYSDEIVPALGHTAPDSNGNCTRCGTHVKDVTPTEEPTTEAPEEEEENLNIFQRIIQWFRNLFAGLFGG